MKDDPTQPTTARWFQRKNWDAHVADLEQMAAGDGFRALRDRILTLAALAPTDRVVDVGAGTGLLALAVAPEVERIWAIDISPAMCEHLASIATARGITNLDVHAASAMSLPLPDASVDVVLSNYCYHHLNDRDKIVALADARRVLRPGGRLVIGDMMFRVGLASPRDRAVIGRIVLQMLRRGPAGVWRIIKNALRFLARRWEHPADTEWWHTALRGAGFVDVEVSTLEHEGGIAVGRRAAVSAI